MSFLKSILIGGSLLVGSTMGWTMTCGDGEQLLDGTCFQNAVTSLVYEGVGTSGTYNTVTNMVEGTCSVSTAPFAYSGPLAPFNEPITWHFRGPIELKNFAVYYPSSSTTAQKQKKRDATQQRRHAHRHLQHKHKRAVAVEYKTEIVYVTSYADGNPIVSPTMVSSIVEPIATVATTTSKQHHHKSSSAVSPTSTSGSSTGDWERTAFYDADAQNTEGLTFLNNLGNSALSGTWTPCFGNSLSFMNSDGVSAAASPHILAAGTVVPSDKEYSIWTNQRCDTTCGYCLPGTVAMKGFDGDNKVFAFRFRMPHDYSAVPANGDMPAIWALNSKIGRTQQYPSNPKDSCWVYGCGEFDMFEVLSTAASEYMKSHIHNGQGATYTEDGLVYGGGGSGNYFTRYA